MALPGVDFCPFLRHFVALSFHASTHVPDPQLRDEALLVVQAQRGVFVGAERRQTRSDGGGL